jgi:heptaprenyl diphosphate synthase
MASNGVQLVLARYFIFGEALRYLIPPFLASGFITGIVLGIACEFFCRRSRWYAKHNACTTVAEPETPAMPETRETPPEKATPKNKREERRLTRRDTWNGFFNSGELFAAGLIMMMLLLFCRSLPGRIIQFGFFCLLALLSGKKINIVSTLLMMTGIVFFNLLAPYGKVLAVFGPLRITQGSLFAGLEKAVTLEGLVMLSAACIKSDLRLPGKIGSLLGESLRMLEALRERIDRQRDRDGVIAKLDKTMLELESADTEDRQNIHRKEPKRNAKKVLLLLGMVILTAAAGFAGGNFK